MLMKGVGPAQVVAGTPCNASQFDFTDITGCNLTMAMGTGF